MGNRGLSRRTGSRLDVVPGELQQSRDNDDTQAAAVVASASQFCGTPRAGADDT